VVGDVAVHGNDCETLDATHGWHERLNSGT
jgi:hypothetical protein